MYIVSHTQIIHAASIPFGNPPDMPDMPPPRAPPMTPSMQMMTPVPGPPGPQGPPGVPGDSGESLEQRLYDLLAPVREVEQDDGGDCIPPSREDECKTLILCGTFTPCFSKFGLTRAQRTLPSSSAITTVSTASASTLTTSLS